MSKHLSLLIAACLATAAASHAAVSFSGIADKGKYTDTITFTVNADTTANTTTTATLDGVALPVGVAKTISLRTERTYHEVNAVSRNNTTNAIVDNQTVRFVLRDTERRAGNDPGTEDGIPPHTPYNTVNDAPSAFIGKTFKVIAPAAWPVGLPIPMAVKLVDGTDETVRLNGIVNLTGLPGTTVQMRRGWGSIVAPAKTTAGSVNIGAVLNSLSSNPTINFEAAPTFTTVGGTLSANTTWPAHSRILIPSGGLTIATGVTLNIGEGTIIKVYTGNGTTGSAAEIVNNGTINFNGTETAPIAVVPETPGAYWGGIELPNVASNVTANWTLFHGSGEQTNWFTVNTGYTTHRNEQALFLVAGSGTSPNYGAQLHLTNCFCFSLAGQQMNGNPRVFVNLNRTLMQRAITCGEIHNSKVTIDRSALIEFPGETGNFADADNDGIYLTAGDLSITNTVIGFTKDDGVDSGGNGGNSPFGTVDTDSLTTVTRYVCANNWFEGTYHEGNSLSGTRNVYYNNCVFTNCGQGIEAGYSASSTSDGPNAIVNNCLFVGNTVGMRWGDNYGSGYNYNGTFNGSNNISIYNTYKDLFSGQWHPTQANAWIYQTTATNTFGRSYFNPTNTIATQPDTAHHPTNTLYNPATHAALLAPHMPVPGSNVGVAISTYAAPQLDTSAYAGTFNVRLSTFSSNVVTVPWSVIGKTSAYDETGSILQSGTLTFQPGEIVKTITPAVASPGNYASIQVLLSNPTNAEITGGAAYFKIPSETAQIAASSTGWRYRETRTEPPATWKELNFDDSSPAATEWLPGAMPAGFGSVGGVTFATTVTSGSSTDRTRAFYFRKKFTIADPSTVSSIRVRVRRDDGAVVWLNNETTPSIATADGTFAGPYTYAMTGTTGAVPNSTNSAFITFNLPASKLVAGQNIVAIEVHQATITSSDLLIDFDLVTIPTAPFQLNFTHGGAGTPVLWWLDTAAWLEHSTDLQTWTPVTATGASPFFPPTTGTTGFWRLHKP